MNVASIMMQLGGQNRLGSIQSQLSSDHKDFSNMLGSIFTQIGETPIAENQKQIQLSEDQLNTLNQLLGKTDLSDLVGKLDGQALKFNSETIAKLLGLTKSEFKSVLNGLFNKLSVSRSSSHVDGSVKDQKPKIDDEDQNPIDTIVAIMNLISTMDPKELKMKDLSSLEESVKISKVVELVGKNADLSGKDIETFFQVKEKNEELLNKIKGLLQLADSTKKNSILENTFQSLLTDVRAKNNDSDTTNTQQNKTLKPVVQNDLQVSLGSTDSPSPIQMSHLTISKPEQISLMIPKGTTSTSFDQFVQDFSKVLESSQWIKSPNMNKLLIKLYPEQLGSLRIEILQKDGMMTARIMATTAQAKDLLDSSLQGLKHSFGQQQIQVDKIEVIHSMTEAERFQRQGSNQQQSQHQQQNTQQNNKINQDLKLESTNFQDLLLNVEV